MILILLWMVDGGFRNPLECNHDKNWQIIYSCIALHNFIRLFDRLDNFPDVIIEDDNRNLHNYSAADAAEDDLDDTWRDQLANLMWAQYEEYLNR